MLVCAFHEKRSNERRASVPECGGREARATPLASATPLWSKRLMAKHEKTCEWRMRWFCSSDGSFEDCGVVPRFEIRAAN